MSESLIPMIMKMMGGQGGQPGSKGAQSGFGSFGQMLSGIGGSLGGIANGLFNLFGSENPSDAANKYLETMEGDTSKYLNPWMDAGKRSLPTLENQYNNNINDPTSTMNRIGGTFKESPGYKFQMDEAMRAANNSAAAGGMAGTPAEQQRAQTVAQGLANQDYYNYTDRGINSYNSGINGLSHVSDQGFQGSETMANIVAMMRKLQAENAYSGANTNNQQVGGGIGSIVGGLF